MQCNCGLEEGAEVMKRLICWLVGCRINEEIEQGVVIEYCDRCEHSQYDSWVIERGRLESLFAFFWRMWWLLRCAIIGRKCGVCGKRFWRKSRQYACSIECGAKWIPF